MVITAEWQAAAEQVINSTRRPLVVMVVGAVDTGKSTFCAFLGNLLWEWGMKVAVVDADLGQSDIGLPTTIGMGFMERTTERLRDIPCLTAYFVGNTSPVGHLLPTVTGTKLMAERALALGAEAVIVDTDGLVHGGVGWVLKQHSFELLRPTHVVLLQRAEELAAFAKRWAGIVWTELLKVPVPDAVTQKTREQRKQFREQRFREWLAKCEELTLPLSQVRFRNTMLRQGITVTPKVCEQLASFLGVKVWHAERIGDTVLVLADTPPLRANFNEVRQFFGGAPFIRWVTPSRYEQIIVGLSDRNDELMTVGLTFQMDFSDGVLKVLAPSVPAQRVHTLAFGSLRLALDGTELDTLSPGSL